MRDELVEKVERVYDLLSGVAVGGDKSDSSEYIRLRQELISSSMVKGLLPDLLCDCRDLRQFWLFIRDGYRSWDKRREYLRKEFNSLFKFLERLRSTPSDRATTIALRRVDMSHIQEEWKKAIDRRASDPEGAITIARTLLESVCKCILDDAGRNYGASPSIDSLYAETSKVLKLHPSQHNEEIFKQIFGGCFSVVKGLGALRNHLGDAHGKGKKGIKPDSRHAELAVNLSGAMASYLFATWDTCKKPA